MVPLILLTGLAAAEEPVEPAEQPSFRFADPGAWAGIAAGPNTAVLNRDWLQSQSTVQLEVGGKLGPVRLGGKLRMNHLNVTNYISQLEELGRPVAPGDARITSLGAVVTLPMHIGPVFMATPRVALGASVWNSPMDQQFYESEVLQGEWGGQEPAAGLMEPGGFFDVGLDLGLVVNDHAEIFLGTRTDIVYTGALMVGVETVLGVNATL
ncbi:MAG TPA: hypothetical protein QGF58_10530 [Myxococcota bacterium]|nr:hypothetical protein [Myxococcota bacterium]